MSKNASYAAILPIGLLMCCSAVASARDEWHHPLYLAGGGVWRARVRLELRNEMDREVAGDPVTLRIGRAPGEADLVDARAEAVRVCDAAGNEMLFGIAGPDGRLTTKGPVPAGSGRKEVLGAFTDKLVPAADKFRPDLVLVSAGFDSRKEDPLGRFTLTDEDFADLTKVVLGIARRHASGRLVTVLEGGYNLQGLAAAATAHVKALSDG